MSEFSFVIKKYRTQLLPLAILIFLGLATLLTLTLTKRSQELRSRALADNGQLTLSLLTQDSVAPGGTFEVAVNMVSSQAVVGADILLEFDSSKLLLDPAAPNVAVRPGTSSVFQTFAPVDGNGNFDKARVITSANSTGIVEFGIVAFNWATNTLPTPNPTNSSMSPVATLRFTVKGTASAGQTQLRFKNDQIGGTNSTTDSNIVAIPPGGGDPEDILQTDDPTPYPNATATVIISGFASPAPTATPGISPSATPGSTPPSCTVRSCQDYNNDGVIRIAEIQTIAFRYGAQSTQPDSNYDPLYDLTCDGKILVADIQRQAFYYNSSCSAP